MKRRGIYWSAAQNTVLQKILKRARHHVQVIFVPGNHDEAAPIGRWFNGYDGALG